MKPSLQPVHPRLWKEACHLLIKHLPAFTAARDVEQVLQTRGIPGIANVATLYKRFQPEDSAIVSFASHNHLNEAIISFRKSPLDIIGIDVHPPFPVIPPPEYDLHLLAKSRNRGHQGRKEASIRGAMDGTGPWAGLGGSRAAEKAVVLTGFPGTSPVSVVEKFLEGYEVAMSKEEKMIYKISIPPDANTLYSKFLIIMKAQDDALSVFRELNQTEFRSGRRQITIRAQLIF